MSTANDKSPRGVAMHVGRGKFAKETKIGIWTENVAKCKAAATAAFIGFFRL